MTLNPPKGCYSRKLRVPKPCVLNIMHMLLRVAALGALAAAWAPSGGLPARPLSPRRPRMSARLSAVEVDETQKMMIAYMAKSHESRLLAIKRATAEATGEMEAKIAALEARLADLGAAAAAPAAAAPAAAAAAPPPKSAPVPAPAPTPAPPPVPVPVVAVTPAPVPAPAPVVAAAAPRPAAIGGGPATAAHPAYLRRRGSKSVSARWGAEELALIEAFGTEAPPPAGGGGDDAPSSAPNAAYSRRKQNTKKVSSRWGAEEVERLSS